jgi:hypothetical protein
MIFIKTYSSTLSYRRDFPSLRDDLPDTTVSGRSNQLNYDPMIFIKTYSSTLSYRRDFPSLRDDLPDTTVSGRSNQLNYDPHFLKLKNLSDFLHRIKLFLII